MSKILKTIGSDFLFKTDIEILNNSTKIGDFTNYRLHEYEELSNQPFIDNLDDIVFSLDENIGDFMFAISDMTMNIMYYSFDEKGQDISQFISNYEELILETEKFIYSQTLEFQNLKLVIKLTNKIKIIKRALKSLKKEIELYDTYNKNELLEIIPNTQRWEILFNKGEIYNSVYQIIKNEVDTLIYKKYNSLSLLLS